MTARRFAAMLLASSALAAPGFAQAQTKTPAPPVADANSADDIIVTAQKREESLQNVPISIQAIGTKRLDQLNVTSFNDYAALLPSVSFQSGTPGATQVYMRGVASGGDGNHSGPLPSVGIYLDEQPVTTIDGALDVHIYDIARIESLSGPQGTLYGASSEAGTIRIITNKPSTDGFEGRVDAEVNSVRKGGVGGKFEGLVNVPISANAALRVVGWYERNAGYIDNVAGSRTLIIPPGTVLAPGYTGTFNNAAQVRNDINTTDIVGGRAALKLDLDDSWTATASVIGQELRTKGRFSAQNGLGDLQVQTFFPESSRDRFIQAALTIQGKLGNWDLTYAAAYLDRKAHGESDYTDYAEAYDALYAAYTNPDTKITCNGIAGCFGFTNTAGQTIDPRQVIIGDDHFTKVSQEFRVASPSEDRFRVVAGAFYQRQTHLIQQQYLVAGLAGNRSVNGRPGTLWLTLQDRIDTDYALFGEASFDITPALTLTGGGRAYIYDNTLAGFNGFGNPSAVGGPGVGRCFTDQAGNILPPTVGNGPCPNVGTQLLGGPGIKTNTVIPAIASGQGFTHKLNLTWKPTRDLLFYATWSRGFRPGGINRRPGLGPYGADFLTNYEVGFKTTLLDGKLRFNGAFYEQRWKGFQFAFLGLNSLTQIQNGPNARIRGVEADVNYTPVDGLNFSATGAYTDAVTTTNLCKASNTGADCGGAAGVTTPIGTRLPITPRFKGSASIRYGWTMGNIAPFVQGLIKHQSGASTDLRVAQAALLGPLPAFTTADLRAGASFGMITAEIFAENITDERGQLSRNVRCSVCYQRTYSNYTIPRTIGLRIGAKF